MDNELYRELIIGHYKAPQNWGVLEGSTHTRHEENPVCGDELNVQMRIQNGRIEDVAVSGQGCAISVAAASMLTEEVKERSISEVRELTEDDVFDLLEVPITYTRRKCALLCYTALWNIIEHDEDTND